MSSPSRQLHDALLSSLIAAVADAPHRPLIHHLNADSSWLIQLPRPSDDNSWSTWPLGERRYFNVLIDPWLQGPQSDVARWFSQQWHATESKVQTVKEVEELAWRLDDVLTHQGEHDSRLSFIHDDEISENGNSGKPKGTSPIDAVVISHEFTDHCHRETLVEVNPTVPVLASSKAAGLIRSWKHFDTVVELPEFSDAHSNWRKTSLTALLPSWLSISRIVNNADALYYHSAVMIAFSAPQSPTLGKSRKAAEQSQDEDGAECIIYTPHGISSAALTPLLSASPPIHTLCFIHGLHDVSISRTQQLNLGAHNGLEVQRLLQAKYWVGTHDEVKKGGGLVSWFLERKQISVEDALREEEQRLRVEGKGLVDDLENVSFEEVGNGESRLLL